MTFISIIYLFIFDLGVCINAYKHSMLWFAAVEAGKKTPTWPKVFTEKS